MGYEDDAKAYEEAMKTVDRLQQYADAATPDQADVLGRSYVLNKTLNPEVTTSLILGGADEDLVARANAMAVEELMRLGIDPEQDLGLVGPVKRPVLDVAQRPFWEGTLPMSRNDPLAPPEQEPVEEEKDRPWWQKPFVEVADVTSNVADFVTPEGIEDFVGKAKDATVDKVVESDAFKSVTRATLGTLDTFPQAIQNYLSATFRGVPGTLAASQAYRPTTLGQAVSDAINPNVDVDLGSGYFPAGGTSERRSEMERQYRGTVIGSDGEPHAWTIGRGTANQLAEWGVISRDGRMFDIASGTLDATVTLFGDPTNYIPGVGWGDEVVDGMKAVKSARVSQIADLTESAKAAEAAGDIAAAQRYARKAADLVGTTASRMPASKKMRDWRAVVADEIGIVSVNGVKTVTAPDMLRWLSSGRGRRVVKHMAEETNASRIMQLHGDKITPTLAKQLADATDEIAVLDVYARAMDDMNDAQRALGAVPGMGRAYLPNAGLFIQQKFNTRFRWGQLFPQTTVMSVDDQTQSIKNLRAMLGNVASTLKDNGRVKARGARYDVAENERLVNVMIDAYASGNPGEIMNAYSEIAGHMRRTLVAHGWHPADAAAATQWSTQMGRMQQFTHFETMTGGSPVLSFAEDGQPLPIDLNQLLSNGVHLVDDEALKQAVREQGRIATVLRQRKGDVRLRSVMPEDARAGGGLLYNVERMPRVVLDAALGMWKGVTLLKIGYITKVVPEEMLRVASSGVFQSPWDMLQATIGHGRWARGRYSSDALEQSFDAARQYDALVNLQEELLEEADDLLKAGDDAGHAAKVAEAEALDGELEKLHEAIDDFETNYYQALIGIEPDAARAAITKDTRRQFAQKVWTLVSRTSDPEKSRWVDGLRQALLNKHADMVNRRIANRGLFDGDTLTLDDGMEIVWQSADDINTAGRGAYFVMNPASPGGTARRVKQPGNALRVTPASPVESAGEAAARVLLPDVDYRTLERLLLDDGDVAGAIAYARSIGINIDRADEALLLTQDPLATFDQIGADLARSNGHDAIIATGGGNNDQFVALTDAALVDAGGPVNASWAEHVAAGRTAGMTVEDQIAAWMLNGAGNKWLNAYVTKTAGLDGSFNWATGQGARELIRIKAQDIGYLTGADEAASTALLFDGADEDLLQMIATGRFRGKRAYIADVKTKTRVNNAELEEHLNDFRLLDNAPSQIRSPVNLRNGDGLRSELGERWQDMMNSFFRGMYGVASDKLSRSPTFRRIYWKNISALLPSASADDAAEILRAAEKAGLPKRMMDDLRERARIANGTSNASDIDAAAKGFALDRVRDLLFDASKKGAFFDQARLIFPFGDAYKEVFTAWSKIMFMRGGLPAKSLAKGLRAAQGATGIGPGDMDEDGERDGFIWKSPTSGDWVFSVPFSQKLSQMPGLGGSQYPGMGLSIPVKSMNVLGNVMPGVGPVADQIVNGALPRTGAFDGVRNFLFPYGEPLDPEGASTATLLQRTFFPAWLRRTASADWQNLPFGGSLASFAANIITDRESDPQYLGLRNHVIKQLASETVNGQPRYPMTEQGMADLLADADQTASRLYATRGLVQFFTPAAPMSEYMAETKAGNIHAALVTEELRDLEGEYLRLGQPVGLAAIEIMDKYGPGVWLYTQANTESKYPGMEATEGWWDWWRENKDATDKYPLIGSFFGPAGGEFSIETYGSQMAQGLREPADPAEMVMTAKKDLMLNAYNRFREKIDADNERTDVEVEALRRVRSGLEEQFGINFDTIWNERADRRKNQLQQLIKIVANDGQEDTATRLLASPTGEALQTYMLARDEVIRLAAEREVVGWEQANDTFDLRVALRGVGNALARQDDGFNKMWTYVLQGEMDNDDDRTIASATTAATVPDDVLTDPGLLVGGFSTGG